MSLQYTGDVVLLELSNDFYTSNYQIQKLSKLNKTGKHDFTYNTVSLKFSYMCMIWRVAFYIGIEKVSFA